MKTLNLIAVSACLSLNVSHALTISGQAPQAAEKVWVYAEFAATRKIPVKCTHYNLLGPIFNGGESHGWHIDRTHAHAEALIDEAGNYTVELDYSKLAKSICRFEVTSLSISTAPKLTSQVYLVPSKNTSETIFNFDLSLPYSWDDYSAMADIRNESVFEVNFK
ncbi:MAG: hypothetical protein HYV97_11790 [Bdellovibrio sp.]|nr:hypothetical protein [Bdellovibrio sp.]